MTQESLKRWLLCLFRLLAVFPVIVVFHGDMRQDVQRQPRLTEQHTGEERQLFSVTMEPVFGFDARAHDSARTKTLK